MRRSIVATIASITLCQVIQAQAPVIKPIPRSERPTIAVRGLDFTAQLPPEDERELNGLTGLAVLMGRAQDTRTDAKTTRQLFALQLTNMLEAALDSTQNFRLMDRAHLDAVLGEQDLGKSNRAAANQSTAATGALTTAKYVVTGSITKFGKSNKKAGFLGGIGGGIVHGAIGGGMDSKSTEYDIGITIKVLDSSTGEVIFIAPADATVKGNVERRIGGFGVAGTVAGGAINKGATGEKEKRVAEAMALVAERAAVKIVEKREQGEIPPN